MSKEVRRGYGQRALRLERAIEDVAQVKEPGERGGAPGARGGVVLARHQLHELGSIDVMTPRPDARAVASRCLRIRLFVDENFP
jgi:hypothetical protein